ncbi:O-antigen/teichoic acid export membrane protein [Thiogranum longum]|uniref:O-antigen/teichoic acid export membrane protein n=1 Tax=Thiogranum longum TaxID=1537524 RepID=A0A4R1HFB8_9GAMM|nr:oligosaccharide flippase family protein [Thiogranum longum]TCK19471.1 O-antigen/teichoic acid export membrane protein [Thiogranum longum]
MNRVYLLIQRYRGFFKDAIGLIGSTTLAKIIGLALVPVVTRLFTPDDFGVMAIVLSLGLLFGNVGTLRYDQAIVLPRSGSDAVRLTVLSLWSVFAISTLLLVVSIAVDFLGVESGIISQIGVWIYSIPLIVLLIGFNKVISAWCARETIYPVIGKSEIMASLMTGLPRIAIGFVYGSSIGGLLFGAIFGFIAKGAMLLSGVNLCEMRKVSKASDKGLLHIANQYRDFPVYSVPTGFLREFIQKMPVIVLGVIFMPAVVGLYAMANRIARIPIEIISSSLRRIYVQRIAKLRNMGHAISGVLIKATLGLFLLGLVPYLTLAFFGEPLFGWLLGKSWAASGKYASILVPWLFSVFIVSPSTTNFIVLKRQPLLLKIQFYTGVLGLGVFLVAYLINAEPELSLVMYSSAATLANMVLFAISLLITRSDDRDRELLGAE